MTHAFGGSWTDEKLEALRRYIGAYNTALKHKPTKERPFLRIYVDAFAGTGERTSRRSSDATTVSLLSTPAEAEVKKGSTVIALEADPRFAKYIFIEKSGDRAAELQKLADQHPGCTIEIVSSDANEALTQLATSINWQRTRALVFIDPYGMQVSWATLEALAATKAVDIALLFPTGPLNRMLKRHGSIPQQWQRRIDGHLGCSDWRNEFYKERTRTTLFGDEFEETKTATIEALRQFAQKRLQQIFPWVCDTALPLANSKGSVLYHLFIVCANPSSAAGELAMKLARSAVNPRKKAR